MAQNNDPHSAQNQPETAEDQGLRLLWGNFNTWDKTANKRNAVLRRWRKLVLVFIIAGAFCGVLSSNMASIDQPYFGYISQALAFISTLFVALASYAGSEILTNELEKAQIKARAAAEAYKSEAYLYIFKAPPYDESPENTIFERVDRLEEITGDITQEPVAKEAEASGLPNPQMTIDDYIKERIEDQIYNYFTKKIQGLQSKQKRGKNFTLAFGFAGIILGALSSTGLGFTRHSASWIAFITSASAAITSFMATNRYQYLISSYQATSNRLKTLLAKWKQIPQKNKATEKQFVLDVESELMRENQAWVDELSKQLEKDKDLTQVAKQQKQKE